MSLSGARGLARIATNLECELQAAMVADRYSETKLYRALTGQDYPREYGERLSARQRGAKFEANLYQNDAALLRQATGPVYGHDPETMWVRNFLDEVPGEKIDRLALRASRFRQIMRDLALGRRVPELIIQPALLLKIGPDANDVQFINPDCLVLDRRSMMYVPGELKSFIVRDVGPNPEDLAPTRLQAAAQVVALRQEAGRVGLDGCVLPRVIFVFATPWGLKPTDGMEERLHAEFDMVTRAIRKLGRASRKLAALRTVDAARLADLALELGVNFQENCIANCALADICRSRHLGRAAELGDAAMDLFGPDADLDRLSRLALGARPTNPEEAAIAPALRDARLALGIDHLDPVRRTA